MRCIRYFLGSRCITGISVIIIQKSRYSVELYMLVRLHFKSTSVRFTRLSEK